MYSTGVCTSQECVLVVGGKSRGLALFWGGVVTLSGCGSSWGSSDVRDQIPNLEWVMKPDLAAESGDMWQQFALYCLTRDHRSGSTPSPGSGCQWNCHLMLIYNLLSMQQYGKLQESYYFLTSTSRHKNCNCDSHISVRGEHLLSR